MHHCEYAIHVALHYKASFNCITTQNCCDNPKYLELEKFMYLINILK